MRRGAADAHPRWASNPSMGHQGLRVAPATWVSGHGAGDSPVTARNGGTSQDSPQHDTQFFHVDSRVPTKVLRQHLAFQVHLLQPIFQVHDALQSE